MRIVAEHITDPGCPWAYSARPWHARLRWRFGDQLDWRLTMIGLTESADQYVARGYTAERAAQGLPMFAERFGMPFQLEVKAGLSATSPACRAIVLAREADPALGEAAFRALQFLHFTTLHLLEDLGAIHAALATVAGVDADAIMTALEEPATWALYDAGRARAREAAGSPTDVQGRASDSDGPVRYTAPSVIFTHPDGRTAEVGGFQPFEAYDTILANLEPELERRPPPEDAVQVLRASPDGLVTAELAEVLRSELGVRDLQGTGERLRALETEGRVRAQPVGGDVLWRAA